MVGSKDRMDTPGYGRVVILQRIGDVWADWFDEPAEDRGSSRWCLGHSDSCPDAQRHYAREPEAGDRFTLQASAREHMPGHRCARIRDDSYFRIVPADHVGGENVRSTERPAA